VEEVNVKQVQGVGSTASLGKGTFPINFPVEQGSPPGDEFVLDAPHLLGVWLGIVGGNRLVIALSRHASVWL
jgi:hypothetical protein